MSFSKTIHINLLTPQIPVVKSRSLTELKKALSGVVKGFFFLLISFLILPATAQNDSIPKKDTVLINKKLLTGILVSEAVVYAGSFTGLYFLWYKNYPQSEFHFFNDGKEWMQMDKMGHVTSNYYIAKGCYSLLRISGVNEKKSVIYGALTGLAYQTTIEIFDGFSQEWGFSWGDMAANIAGEALFTSQQLLWKEQRLIMKLSCHRTKFADYRPDLLGGNWAESFLKDYNGLTFWLSLNIHSFLPDQCRFPRWLNIAIGYGAEGMLGGYGNPATYRGKPLPFYERYRQFYLSTDIDLTRIKTNKKWLKIIFNTIGFIKIPAPAIEFNTRKEVKFHYFYF